MRSSITNDCTSFISHSKAPHNENKPKVSPYVRKRNKHGINAIHAAIFAFEIIELVDISWFQMINSSVINGAYAIQLHIREYIFFAK
ncbi:hypothetical protein bcgnr5390_01640 [Bacillus luti]